MGKVLHQDNPPGRWRRATSVCRLSTLSVEVGCYGFRGDECRRNDVRMFHTCSAGCDAPVMSLRATRLWELSSREARNVRYWAMQQRLR